MKTFIDRDRIKLYTWMGLGYFLLGILTTWANYPNNSVAVIANNFWGVLYLIILNFILFEYTLPYILKKRKTVLYNIFSAILLLFVHMILYSYGSYLWRSIGIRLGIYTALATYPSLDKALQNQMAYSAGSIFLFGFIRHTYAYVKLKQATQQLRIEKQAAELNYLKSQTNPHFLFNTLNNIYSLARTKSDLAPESILRLSKILRFMLYETGGSFIAVEDELKIMNDYIELEKLRYDESLRISFNNDIEDMKQALPPLLLIPLVENAFKHGVSETRGNPYVNVHLSIRQRQLLFIVKNSVESPGEKNVKENIGLSNLRRQLELLYKEFSLEVEQSKAEFTAILKINLASHA